MLEIYKFKNESVHLIHFFESLVSKFDIHLEDIFQTTNCFQLSKLPLLFNRL